MVGGGWPPSLVEVRQQDKVLRHPVEQIIEDFVPVQIFDGPVPQSSMGGVQDQILQRTAELVPEEVVLVIEVSKISFQDRIPRRASPAVAADGGTVGESACPCPPPSATGSAGRRPTGPQATRGWAGFEWCQIRPSGAASPRRYTNTGQESCGRRPWFREASVPAVQEVQAVTSSTACWTFQVPTVTQQCKLCRGPVVLQVQGEVVDVPDLQRQAPAGSSSHGLPAQKTVEFSQVQLLGTACAMPWLDSGYMFCPSRWFFEGISYVKVGPDPEDDCPALQ